MSIFPRPLKKVLGKIIPFSLVDLIPTFNLGTGTASTATFLRGDQTWSTVPTISGGGGNNVNYYLNGGTAASVGTYYQMSNTPVIGTGVDFSLSGNGLITQWLTDVGNPNTTEIPAGNWNFEMFMSASSAGGIPKFYMEILKYDGSTFTTIANNSVAPESITGGTLIDLYLSSVAVPFTSLLITDRLAVRVYIVDNTPGRTITQHTQDSHLCQIITSFSSGISSINALTKNTQYIVAGTAGSDFNVSSSVDTHTLNLPTASALKRGALSSVDWSTFNAKQNPITLTTTGTGAATFVSDVLNIPTPSAGSGLTVGTTAITSGTVGRILFEGTGNVLQEDAGLVFDSTAKTLTNYGKGAIGTNTSFGLQVFENITTAFQNSAFGVRSLQKITTSNYNASFGYNSLLNHSTGDSNSAFGWQSLSGSTSGISNSAFGMNAGSTITSGYGNIVIGASSTTGITTGTFNTLVGCNITGLATSTSNSVILTDGNGMSGIALWKNASNFVGIGYNPTTATLGAKLDVRAQGALSTDIAFRVRNSADTTTLQQFNGDGSWLHRNNANSWYEYFDGSSKIEYRRVGTFELGTNNDVTSFNFTCNTGNVLLRGGGNILNIINGNNYHFEESIGILATSGAGAIVMKNRTAPSTNVQDRHYYYSADIVAGNAAPHFRTENGNIIKLYQQATGGSASTFVANTSLIANDTATFDGYTIGQVVKALRNLGILA